MTSIVVNPRFSTKEMKEIDRMVAEGEARSRADFVRKAAVEYIRSEGKAKP